MKSLTRTQEVSEQLLGFLGGWAERISAGNRFIDGAEVMLKTPQLTLYRAVNVVQGTLGMYRVASCILELTPRFIVNAMDGVWLQDSGNGAAYCVPDQTPHALSP